MTAKFVEKSNATLPHPFNNQTLPACEFWTETKRCKEVIKSYFERKGGQNEQKSGFDSMEGQK